MISCQKRCNNGRLNVKLQSVDGERAYYVIPESKNIPTLTALAFYSLRHPVPESYACIIEEIWEKLESSRCKEAHAKVQQIFKANCKEVPAWINGHLDTVVYELDDFDLKVFEIIYCYNPRITMYETGKLLIIIQAKDTLLGYTLWSMERLYVKE